MVTILRKVLQLYAARVLRFDAAEAAAQLAQMMPPDAAEKVQRNDRSDGCEDHISDGHARVRVDQCQGG